MKRTNRYRISTSSNVKLLERDMSLKTRLFRMLTIKRGTRRLMRWLKVALVVVPVLAILYFAVHYALEKAYGLSIEHISYKSHLGIISKEQAMHLLGVEGSVNIATLDTEEFRSRLEAASAVSRATVRAELPDTLHIEIEERIPIVYVEMEDGLRTGSDKRFFMDPNGVIFAVQPEYHRQYMGVPVWYLRPDDVAELRDGTQLDSHRIHPITELIAAVNAYSPAELPNVLEISRPKDWQLRLVLESGTEVLMEVRNVRDQVKRLAIIMEHARATGRTVTSANVIPEQNPAVRFAPAPR